MPETAMKTAPRFLSLQEATDIVEGYSAKKIKQPATYFNMHVQRYVATLCTIPFASHDDATCIEFGASHLFQWLLKTVFGYKTVHGTYFGAGERDEIMVEGIDYWQPHKAFFINLENETLPVADNTYDFALCTEVIEHMDVDPMHFMADINRTLKVGGQLLMTTPNSASATNVAKILNGFAPHLFMQYTPDRDPYRHNIEYDVHQVRALCLAAGLDADLLTTVDTFAPTPGDALELLKLLNCPTVDRGDNIFYLGHKAGPVRNRYPDPIYVQPESGAAS